MHDEGPVHQRIGRNIRQLRQRRGWTQEGLADRAEQSISYFKEIEAGKGNPTVDALMSIARALAVDLSDLTSGSVNERTSPPDVAVSEAHIDQLLGLLEQAIAILKLSKRTGT